MRLEFPFAPLAMARLLPATVRHDGLAPSATGLYQFDLVVQEVPDHAAVPLTFSLAGTIPAHPLYNPIQHETRYL